MVTEMVVKEALSEQMMSSGAELIRRLDEAGFVVSAALWFYDSEANDWRFIIATPDLHRVGVRAAYKEVHLVVAAMPKERSIPLKSISVVDPANPTISVLRVALKTGTDIAGIRFSRNMINGTFIEDSYIYRLT
jgi:hypothetical protein